MRVAAAVLLLAAAGLAVPSAPAQESLVEALGTYFFPEIVVTVWGEKIVLEGKRMQITGQAASELRACMDDNADCPDATMGNYVPDGNGDNTVQQAEVDAFENAVSSLLDLLANDFREQARDLVKIDNVRPTKPSFTDFQIDQATGGVTRTTPILISVRLEAKFENVDDSNRHTVTLTRQESQLNITNRIVVEAGDGWKIKSETIEPAAMQRYYSDGRIAGSQNEFESPTPLVFDIEKSGGVSTVVWLASGLLLLLVAGGTAYYLLVHRRKG